MERAEGAYSIHMGNMRAIWNTPATTIVAAWMRADTGVGPSMASGNQMWRGNMALLPAPPININTSAAGMINAPAATVGSTATLRKGAAWTPNCTVPVKEKLNECAK